MNIININLSIKTMIFVLDWIATAIKEGTISTIIPKYSQT